MKARTLKKEVCLISLLIIITIGCVGKVEGDISLEDFFYKSPSVASTYPADLENNISRKTNVRIIFDKDMNSKSITANTFIIKDGNGNIEGDVTYSDKEANFKPKIDLEANTTYTVSLSKEVKDS